MRVALGIICICLTFFLLGGSCSREEKPPVPIKKGKVVKPIKRPVSEEAIAPRTSQGAEVKQEEEEREEVKVAAAEEKPSKVPEKVAKEIGTVLEGVGFYVVKEGDSLSSIAGKEDVYGDPLKWPILYRLNMDKFATISLGEDFPEESLPEGVMLKTITPEQAKTNLKKRANHFWVVNVKSATKKEEIIPPAIRLMNNGYRVYITRAKVKGKDYMRLRIGFFETRIQAKSEGKNIMAMLNLHDSWTNKIGEEEFEEFARY